MTQSNNPPISLSALQQTSKGAAKNSDKIRFDIAASLSHNSESSYPVYSTSEDEDDVEDEDGDSTNTGTISTCDKALDEASWQGSTHRPPYLKEEREANETQHSNTRPLKASYDTTQDINHESLIKSDSALKKMQSFSPKHSMTFDDDGINPKRRKLESNSKPTCTKRSFSKTSTSTVSIKLDFQKLRPDSATSEDSHKSLFPSSSHQDETDTCVLATEKHCQRNEITENKSIDNSSKEVKQTKDMQDDSSDCDHTNVLPESKRVPKILKITESNIMILLSRVSVKTDPSPHLLNPRAMSSLLCYLKYASLPIDRCARLLLRLCCNPLCFQRFLMMQVPALIVKHLVLEQDGTLPRSLFTTVCEDKLGSVRMYGLMVARYIAAGMESPEMSSSQSSEFGTKMDFEFGGDAYSRSRHRTAGILFRGRPTLSYDSGSQTASSHVGR